jgi:hypothetical protein
MSAFVVERRYPSTVHDAWHSTYLQAHGELFWWFSSVPQAVPLTREAADALAAIEAAKPKAPHDKSQVVVHAVDRAPDAAASARILRGYEFVTAAGEVFGVRGVKGEEVGFCRSCREPVLCEQPVFYSIDTNREDVPVATLQCVGCHVEQAR